MRRKILIVQVSPRRGGRGAQVDGRYHLLHRSDGRRRDFFAGFPTDAHASPRVEQRENPVRDLSDDCAM